MKSETTCDVVIRKEDHDRLMAHLYPGDGDEYGAVLRAGIVSGGAGLRVLVNAVEPARVGTDYVPGKLRLPCACSDIHPPADRAMPGRAHGLLGGAQSPVLT